MMIVPCADKPPAIQRLRAWVGLMRARNNVERASAIDFKGCTTCPDAMITLVPAAVAILAAAIFDSIPPLLRPEIGPAAMRSISGVTARTSGMWRAFVSRCGLAL